MIHPPARPKSEASPHGPPLPAPPAGAAPAPARRATSGQRQRRWLISALFVLLGVTVAYSLSLPGMSSIPIASARGPAAAASVLVGVVLLFCLYVLMKHDQIERAREAGEGERQRDELSALRAHVAEVEALFDASILLSLHPDVRRMLELTCRRVITALDAELASVLLLDPDGANLETRAREGRHAALLAAERFPAAEGLIGRVMRHGRGDALRSPELAVGPPVERALATLDAVAVVPVRVKARIAGVVLVGGSDRLAAEHTLTALGFFAESLGSALTRLERERRMIGRLERLNRELVEHHRQLEIFLATATHELRTPLSGVVSYAEVLGEYYDTISEDERRSLCSALNQQCKALMGLVEELFDFARLETGRITLEAEPTRISDLVASATDLLAPVAGERGLTIERRFAQVGPVVLDPTKIRQCVLNLLSNAIKFTPSGGTITMTLSASEEGVEVLVTDTGPGIAPEEVDRIFDLFHSKAGRQAPKSLGLGLYLVKSFVELHGGRVWVKSRPDHGSSFGFALPWSPPPSNVAETQAA